MRPPKKRRATIKNRFPGLSFPPLCRFMTIALPRVSADLALAQGEAL